MPWTKKMSHHTVKFKAGKENRIAYQSLYSIRSESLRLSTYDRLAQLDKHQTSDPVMVSCEFDSHWRVY